MMRTPRLSRTTPAGKRSLENSLSISMSLGVSGGMIERRKSPQEGQGEDWASRESVPVRSPNPAPDGVKTPNFDIFGVLTY
jgi:hypothetical protein